MKKTLTASAATFLALALAIPAFAGGDHCGGASASAATADAHGCCAGKNMSTAWGGAWLQRSSSGTVIVADVAKGSPAARSGLKSGDIVLAVNGYDLSKTEDHGMCASRSADHAAMCASKSASASASACNVGSAVTYTVQRGRSTKSVKFKLEKMPANATERYPSRLGTFDPMLAAVVMPAVD